MSMEVKWSFPTNSGRRWPQPQSKKKKSKQNIWLLLSLQVTGKRKEWIKGKGETEVH